MKISVTCVTCDPVGRLLPQFAIYLESWGNDAFLNGTSTWGEYVKTMRNLLFGELSQTLVWGKQSVRLSAAAFP